MSYNISFHQQSAFHQTPVIPFERDFNEEAFSMWIGENWSLSIWCAAVYLLVIYSGRSFMEKRPKFDIRPALVLWNTILAIFSIFGAARTVPEAIFAVRHHGWDFSVCDSSYTGLWTCLFALSKVYELGDTLFIVLRKQRLIFLHWYHHVTVLIYCWYSYSERIGPGRWFMVVNYSIHACMYSYYALKALQIKLPRFIPFTITTMQIIQVRGWPLFILGGGEAGGHFRNDFFYLEPFL